MENRDTDDEGEIDPTPGRSRKAALYSTEDDDEDDDFSNEENKQCDNYNYDRTVELDDGSSSDDEIPKKRHAKPPTRVDIVEECMENFLSDPHPSMQGNVICLWYNKETH
jgi:hypothetical protein